jgi:hypothetical protein
MTYEVAKKLKDNCFPFTKCEDKKCNHIKEIGSDFHYLPPTLSELIEACGHEFGQLYRRDSDRWLAVVPPKWLTEEPRLESYGSTPEEAVANLWLALNGK